MTNSLQQGKTRWCQYQTGYHIVWIPKYRRKVLQDDVAAAFKRLVAECCDRHGLTLVSVETDLDHAHLFVSAPPSWSPAKLAGVLKGFTSLRLRKEFPKLVRLCGEDELWSKTYYVGTVGQVSAETIRRYIEECQGR